jgi:hypothetical protein
VFPERSSLPVSLERIVGDIYVQIDAEQKRAQEIFMQAKLLRRKQTEPVERARRKRAKTEELLFVLKQKAIQGKLLTDADCTLLRERGAHGALATYYEHLYRCQQDPRLLVLAGSEWMSDGNPKSALAVTDPLLPDLDHLDPKLCSALLTTRGAAHRSCGNLLSAIKCTRTAIARDRQNPLPYRLLGIIHLTYASVREAEKCFQKVAALSGSSTTLRREIEGGLELFSGHEKLKIINALRALNPERYSWLRPVTPWHEQRL